MHHGVRLAARVAANRARRRGCISADRELVGQEVPHSAIIHHEQNNICLRSANLKPDTSAFNPHRGRGAPARATAPAAHREPAAILRAEDESGLFHARHDNDAVRFVEQILRDALIGSPHHIGQRFGRSIQPVVDLDFSVRRESGGNSWNRQLPKSLPVSYAY